MPRRLALLLALSLPLLASCDSSPPPAPAAVTPAPAPAAAPADATVPAEASALFGTWAANLGWCDGTGDGAPVTISATRFEGRESLCDITGLTDNGDSFSASLVCMAGDQSSSEAIVMTPIYAPSGQGIHLDWPDRGGARTTVLRCR